MSVTNYPLVTGVGSSGGSDRVLSYANAAAFPATGAVGYVYIDEALADMYLWDGAAYELQGGTTATETGFWFIKPLFPDSLAYFIEEFDYFPIIISNGTGNLYSPVSGTSASVQVRDASEANAGINATEKAIGVTSLNTGTQSTGRAALGWGGAQGAASFKIGVHEMIFGVRQNTWVLSTVTDNFTKWVGFMDIITAQPTNGAYFRQNYNVNGGRWEYCTTVSGATTAADTGVSPTAAVYQVMEIKVTKAATPVATFYIDGTLVGTITGGLPSVGLLAMTAELKSAGTTGAIVAIDAMYMATERLSVR
jgi:hypothetical protein